MKEEIIIDLENIFDKLIILTGHRKSGTSMFQRLFDSHPDLYVFPIDIAVLYAYFPVFTKKYSNDFIALRKRLKLVLIKSIAHIEAKIDKEGLTKEVFATTVDKKLENHELLSKEFIINAIANSWIELYYQSNEKKPFVFKETTQSIFIDEYLQFSTPVKIVHLIRDPRDNFAAIKAGVKGYYSKMNESEKESLASVINRARIDLISADVNSMAYKDVFKAIKFENLIQDLVSVMGDLAEFLSIPNSDTLLTPTELGQAYFGNNHEGKQIHGVSSQNIGNWVNRISKDEAQIIEYCLNDVMKIWDYDQKFKREESQRAYSQFYSWYNTKYFYRDSFDR